MAITAPRNSTNVRQVMGWALTYLRFRIASLAAPTRAADAAARRFATPPRFQHTAPELELLSLGERFTVGAGDVDLAAWRFGRGERPAVLMSHGWGGRGAQFRRFVAPLRDAGYQVVLFDHVGHGHSGGDASTLVHFAAGIEAVAKHVEASGARIAGIVGHSLGAAATGAWLNANGRTPRAVLIAAPTSLQRYSELFARQLGLSEKVRAAMQQRFEALLGRPWKDFELPGAVARVRAPALVIHDRDDTEVHPRAGLALARAWPGARYLATNGLGHRGVLRDAAVIQDVVDFLADRVVFAPPPEASRGSGIPAPLL